MCVGMYPCCRSFVLFSEAFTLVTLIAYILWLNLAYVCKHMCTSNLMSIHVYTHVCTNAYKHYYIL